MAALVQVGLNTIGMKLAGDLNLPKTKKMRSLLFSTAICLVFHSVRASSRRRQQYCFVLVVLAVNHASMSCLRQINQQITQVGAHNQTSEQHHPS